MHASPRAAGSSEGPLPSGELAAGACAPAQLVSFNRGAGARGPGPGSLNAGRPGMAVSARRLGAAAGGAAGGTRSVGGCDAKAAAAVAQAAAAGRRSRSASLELRGDGRGAVPQPGAAASTAGSSSLGGRARGSIVPAAAGAADAKVAAALAFLSLVKWSARITPSISGAMPPSLECRGSFDWACRLCSLPGPLLHIDTSDAPAAAEPQGLVLVTAALVAAHEGMPEDSERAGRSPAQHEDPPAALIALALCWAPSAALPASPAS
eukprot:360838-Chlamydomonas_euryale.AAC.8